MPPTGLLRPANTGSNAWAVGADLVTGGEGGLLVGNPALPVGGRAALLGGPPHGARRDRHHGANLTGLPGIGIGFTDEFAWSHTVSAGNRFTAYTLTLDPADPTSYLVDGEVRAMTSTDHEVEVLQPGGSTTVERERCGRASMPRSSTSPASGDGDDHPDVPRRRHRQRRVRRPVRRHDGRPELRRVRRRPPRPPGHPAVNTIAVSNDGRAWYADTAATPNLSAEAEALYLERLDSDPITGIARQNGVVLLDGSDSRFVWEDAPGARDPGLVPFEEMPIVERGDYVFNANDSFWMPHATEMLAGDYGGCRRHAGHAALAAHGAERRRAGGRAARRAPRAMDGTFTGVELATREAPERRPLGKAGSSSNRSSSGAAPRSLVGGAQLLGDDDSIALPAESVDITAACGVLAGWDTRYDLDSRGAVLWREVLAAVRRDVPGGLDAVWAEPFDALDPSTRRPAWRPPPPPRAIPCWPRSPAPCRR